jgi:hypothetical protein
VITLLGSQATGLANAEYDLTVVTVSSKDARATYLPNQDSDRLGWPKSTSTLLLTTRSATCLAATFPSTPLSSPSAA